MSLLELIAEVENHRSVLTLYHAGADVRDDLAERFADRNMTVSICGSVTSPEDSERSPEPFAVLTQDGAFITATSLADLLEPSDPTEPGFTAGSYDAVLGHLDETLFTSYTRGRMVAASREIEDRAWRRGAGELRAGFQTLDVFATQSAVYSTLASKPGLAVHAYAAPVGSKPECAGVSVHVGRTEEIRNCWFVAYDGAGRDVDKCLLLAAEREPGSFWGFWSYDPGTVDYVFDHLRSTYDAVGTDDGADARV